MARRLHSGEIIGWEELPGGAGVRVTARVARDGVKEYVQPNGKVTRVHWPADKVLATVRKLEGAPVTSGKAHPKEGVVTPDTWRRYAVGHVSRVHDALVPHAGHQWAVVDLVINDPKEIARIRAKEEIQTSLGQVNNPNEYGPGDSALGYDSTAPEGIPNHLTLLPVALGGAARAGAQSRVLLDSNDNEVTPLDPNEILDKFEALNARILALETENAALKARPVLDAKVTELETQLQTVTQERDQARAVDVGALVRDELAFRAQMSGALPAGYDFTGKTRRQAQIDAIRHLGGTAVLDSASDAYVQGVFETRLDAAKANQGNRQTSKSDVKTPDQIRAEKRAALNGTK